MAELESVRSFLKTVSYEEKHCECLNLEKGRNPFITISREAGAGGHSLALAVMKELSQRKEPYFQGWAVFDQEICKMLAEDPELNVTIQGLLTMEYRSQIQDTIEELALGTSPQHTVLKKMFEVIRTLASFGKVILVGRGASFLTRELPLGIHLRLTAPLPVRIKRMMQLLNLDEKKAKEIIQNQDKARAALIKNFFNKDISDPLMYDAVWNTGSVPLETIARAAVQMAADRKCHCQQPDLMIPS